MRLSFFLSVFIVHRPVYAHSPHPFRNDLTLNFFGFGFGFIIIIKHHRVLFLFAALSRSLLCIMHTCHAYIASAPKKSQNNFGIHIILHVCSCTPVDIIITLYCRQKLSHLNKVTLITTNTST